MSNASQADFTPNGALRGEPPAPPTHLTGAQLEAIRKQMIAEFQRAVDDVEMRKVAVDAACKILPQLPAHTDPVKLIQSIYAFMAEPAAEIVVKIS